MTSAPSRILVCILGETRSHRHTWKSFKKNVLDVLGAELALCIATPPSYDHNNPFWQNASYRWTSREYEDYGDAFDFASRLVHRTDDECPDWRILLSVGSQWLGGIKGANQHPGSAAILIFFRWLLWRNILREGLQKRFTHFLVTRSDFIWTRQHPDLLSIDRHAIWLPSGERWGGVTDRYALVPADALEQYLNLLEEMLVDPGHLRAQMSGRDNWNLERFIDFSLNRRVAGRSIKTFQYYMYSVREIGGTTRWTPGDFDPYKLRYIKYPTEFAACALLRLFLEDGPHSFDEIIETGCAVRFNFVPVSARIGLQSRSHDCAHARISGEVIHNLLLAHDLNGFGDLAVMPIPHIFRPLFPRRDRFLLRIIGGPYVRRRGKHWDRLPVPPPRRGRRMVRFLLLSWLLISGGLFRAEPIA